MRIQADVPDKSHIERIEPFVRYILMASNIGYVWFRVSYTPPPRLLA